MRIGIMADRGTYRSTYTVLLDDLDFQKLSERERHVFHALKATRLGNMAGIFVLDDGEILTLSKQTGIPVIAIRRAIEGLSKGLWVVYETPIIWIRNALKYEPNISLANEKHRSGIESVLNGLPKLSIIAKFCEYYDLDIPIRRAIEGLSKGPRSIETDIEPDIEPEPETEIETEKDNKSSAKPDAVSPELKQSPLESFNSWLSKNQSIIIEMVKTIKNDPSYDACGGETDNWAREQIRKVRLWIISNTDNGKARKKDWKRFFGAWLNKAIDEKPDKTWRPYEGYMTASEERQYYASKVRTDESS